MTIRFRTFIIFASIAICAACLWTTAAAQTSSGQINGRVVDTSDAVIVGADVTLLNPATGETRNAKTDNAGTFSFVALQPGTFNVTVKAPSFKQLRTEDLHLSASQRLSTGDLKLEPGAVTQQVSVAAEAALVQTESAERSAEIDSKELSTLMSIGRDPLGLLRVLPGVVNGGGSSQLGTEGAGYIAGVRQEYSSVSIDGVQGNPRGDGNKLDTPVNMDAISEVKVQLNSYQAEYGQSGGAIINLVTKSGTRDFHGTAYYYGRNEAFNANSWFNNYKGTPRPEYRFNTYGWTVGGPAYVPGHFNRDKDKLFFFFSQERWPTKTTGGDQLFMMPTQAERNGDFSHTYDAKGQKVFIGDPLLLAAGKKCSASDQSGCFPGNIIPADRINPNTQKLMNIFPMPTLSCAPFGGGGAATCPLTNVTSGNPYNFAILSPPRQEPTNQTLLRLDYNLNSKFRMYFRGTDMSKENRGLTSTVNKTPWGIPTYYSTPGLNAGYNLTYLASPTLINEFTVGYASWKEEQGFANAGDVAKLSKSDLGIALGQNNPAQNPLSLVPRITGLSSGGSNGTFQLAAAPSIDFDNRFPMKNMTGTWEFTDGLTKIWHQHQIKAGAYYQAGRYLQRHIGSVFSGNFNFGTTNSSPYDSQYAYSNMLLGSYQSYQEGSNVVDYAPHWHILEWYVQDSWKAKSNLSVDYGVRFTYDLPTNLAPGFGASFVTGRYAASQVPALYMPVAFKSLSKTAQTACQGTSRTAPSRCAQNPSNTADIKSDAFIGTFVSPFNYSGTVVNTDRSYPQSLRNSNGLLLAPRFGIAWDPFHDGKTAVRFGGGLYYNTREGGGTVGDYSLIAPLVTNASVGFGQVAGSAFSANCGSTGNCYGTSSPVNASPVDTRILEPNRKIESILGTNFGIQRKIGFETVVDVAYVGTFGRHLNQQYDLNAIPYLAQFDPKFVDASQTSQNCFYYAPHHNGTTLCQPKLLSDNYFRPYPGYNHVYLRDYGATSNYNALQASVNRRFARSLQFGVSYTWSKTMTTQDTVDGNSANFQSHRFWDYSLASFDRTHNLVAHWMYTLPNASRLWNNKVFAAIGNNWEWSGIAEFVSGAPFGVTMSGTPNLTGGGDGARVLLNGSPYANLSQVHSTLDFLNRDAFTMPPVGVVPTADLPGITRAVVFRGPGTNNFDMALQKNIPITERVRFTLRAEAYNVFNHVSFNGVDTTAAFDTATSCSGAAASDPNCGSGHIKTTSTFGQVDGERGARKLQLSGRITF